MEERQDLISRRAAIDAIHCDITVTGKQNAELVASTIGAFVDRIKALPSAQQDRKLGKWINSYKRQTCSVCKQRGYRSWSFCPNCGADMRGEQE